MEGDVVVGNSVVLSFIGTYRLSWVNLVIRKPCQSLAEYDPYLLCPDILISLLVISSSMFCDLILSNLEFLTRE